MESFHQFSGKVHFEALIHLLRYIKDNKNLGLKYYSKIDDTPLYDLLRQAGIKTENQLMLFPDSILQESPDTGISTGEYIVFYQGVPIYHCTHVPGTVFKSSSES